METHLCDVSLDGEVSKADEMRNLGESQRNHSQLCVRPMLIDLSSPGTLLMVSTEVRKSDVTGWERFWKGAFVFKIHLDQCSL